VRAYVLLALFLCACAARDRSGPRPPRSVLVGAARGDSVTLMVGPGHRTRAIAHEPDLTLVSALSEALTPKDGETPHVVALWRSGTRYTLDFDAILRGDRPDEPLEPGDRVVVDEDLPMRPPPPASARIVDVPAAPSPSPDEPMSCGELLLKEAGLRANGHGDGPADTSPIHAAIRAQCVGEIGDSLLDACASARRELLSDREQGYGPAHPDIRRLRAELSICPPPGATPAPAPPTASECAALRARRDALAAAGKGAKHPDLVEVEARLGTCP
jgi:hypothetical protein